MDAQVFPIVDVGETAIVAGEPDERVPRNAEVSKSLPQGTNGTVHGRQFAELQGRTLVGAVQVGGHILLGRLENTVGCRVPDQREHRPTLLRLPGDEFEGFVNDHLGTVALELFRDAISAQHRIQVELRGNAQPIVEAELTGIARVAGRYLVIRVSAPVQMPLAKMRGGVTGLPECRGQHHFLRVDRIANLEHAGPIVGSACQDCGARWRAHGCGCVKSIHPQTICRHVVEIRRPEERMTVVAGLRPTVVVRHHQYHVGFVGHQRRGQHDPGKNDERCASSFHNRCSPSVPIVAPSAVPLASQTDIRRGRLIRRRRRPHRPAERGHHLTARRAP